MLPSRGLHIDQAPPLHIPMRFFVTAPLFLIVSGLLLVKEGQAFFVAPLVTETVALVHLITLGWIATVMFGAMYQMIPVLGGGPVPWLASSRWVHALLVIGVISLTVEVGLSVHPWLLLVASVGLGGAFLLFILPVGTALIRAPIVHPTIWAMRLAIVSLLAVLIMGLIFLGEYAHGFFSVDRHAMVGVHLVWGLFGWIATLIMGVSFHVLPMFYMMPPFPRPQAHAILIGLGATWVLLPTIILLIPAVPFWGVWVAALPAVAALILYGVTVARLIRQRKRKKADIPLRLWLTGYASGVAALLVLVAWPLVESDTLRYVFAAFFLFGCVSSIMMGMLYRIVPFLTWFHRYSQQAGAPGVPMMDDLTSPGAGRLQLWNQWVGVGLLVTAIVTNWDPLIRLSGVSLALSGIVLLYLFHYALRRREQS